LECWTLHTIARTYTALRSAQDPTPIPESEYIFDFYCRALLYFDSKDQLLSVFTQLGSCVLTTSSDIDSPARWTQDQPNEWKPQDLASLKEALAYMKGKKSSIQATSDGTPISANASGTGFFITPDGYLITNQHVIDGAKKVAIRKFGTLLTAQILHSDSKNDLALLKVQGKFDPLPIGNSDQMKLGMAVCTLGYPNVSIQGERAKFTKGEISSVAGLRDDPRYFQISVPLQPGNSGGALIDEQGNVIGVVTMKLDAVKIMKEQGDVPQNVCYALKGNLIPTFLKQAKTSDLSTLSVREISLPWTSVAEQAESASALIYVEK
jgi:S1-C subfamily serine protease